MKQSDLLSVTSILSVLLLALHISQDIVFGFDRAGLNHLVGVAILLVVVCGAVVVHLDSVCPRSDRWALGYPRGPGVARSAGRFVTQRLGGASYVLRR